MIHEEAATYSPADLAKIENAARLHRRALTAEEISLTLRGKMLNPPNTEKRMAAARTQAARRRAAIRLRAIEAIRKTPASTTSLAKAINTSERMAKSVIQDLYNDGLLVKIDANQSHVYAWAS